MVYLDYNPLILGRISLQLIAVSQHTRVIVLTEIRQERRVCRSSGNYNPDRLAHSTIHHRLGIPY